MTGFKLIHRPGIKRFVYLPIVFNAILFLILYSVAGHYWHGLITMIMEYIPHWLHWLSWLLWLMFVILALLIMAFCFGAVSMILGAPFYGLLSQKIQKHLNGPTIPDTSWLETITTMPGMMMRQLKILLAYIIPAIILFCLSWVPVIHIVVTVLWFLLGAKLQVMQSIDLVFENNKRSYDEVKTFYQQNRGQSLLLGTGIMFLLAIPIISWFVLPAAVAGITAWYCDKISLE